MGETAEILRGVWTAETLHGIQGAEKHQEIQSFIVQLMHIHSLLKQLKL